MGSICSGSWLVLLLDVSARRWLVRRWTGSSEEQTWRRIWTGFQGSYLEENPNSTEHRHDPLKNRRVLLLDPDVPQSFENTEGGLDLPVPKDLWTS